MTIGDAVRSCLTQYIGFRGRARRSEYWWFVLAVFLAGVVASIIDAVLFGTGTATAVDVRTVDGEGASYLAQAQATASDGPVASLISLLSFLPMLAVSVRRLHDTDRSGWYLLLPAALIIGATALVVALSQTGFGQGIGTALMALLMLLYFAAAILPFIWFIQRGTAGTNRFGPDPISA